MAEKSKPKLIEQYDVSQKQGEPHRRVFIQDSNQFGLSIWYEDNSLEKILGFQLGFKVNPFNTDEEYLFTVWPKSDNKEVETTKIASSNESTGPATKTHETTTTQPPAEFEDCYRKICKSLPPEIQNYLNRKLKSYLSSPG